MDNCQIFTPKLVAERMLNLIGYVGEDIGQKTIFEPAFGDGIFLSSIVERMLLYAKIHKYTLKETHNLLDKLYGLEIDPALYEKAICRLNEMLKAHGFSHQWKNLICGNTLHYTPPIKFDLCVANPPYRKIHHLEKETRTEIEKNYNFGTGNTDLYVIFFEYCIKAISSNGKLCFITPNSYFRNSSQSSFRKFLSEKQVVEAIEDYANVKIFGKVATYTAIILLNFDKKIEKTSYSLMKNVTDVEYQSDVLLEKYKEKPWNFQNEKNFAFLEEISKRKLKLKDFCDVQYGIATNADSIYICKKDATTTIEPEILRPVIKASTLENQNQIIFPYRWNEVSQHYVAMEESQLRNFFPNAYAYLLKHKDRLEKRDMEKEGTVWYQYARSQGIQNSRNKKIVLKHIIGPNQKHCEIFEAEEDTLVYSGIFIVVKDKTKIDTIKEILLSEEFCKYCFLSGKNMSGGYKNINTKIIKGFGIPNT